MTGRKVWTQETLAVASVQDLQDHGVQTFANAAQRTAQWASPHDGALSALEDTDTLEIYAGAWQPVGGAWPAAQLRQSAAQSGIVANVYTDLIWQAEDLDTHNAHDTTVNPARWTCPAGQAGTYAVQGVAAFGNPPAAGTFAARLARNGTAVNAGSVFVGATFGPALATGRQLVSLATGDYVTLQAMCTSGPWATQVGGAGNEGVGSLLVVERVR